MAKCTTCGADTVLYVLPPEKIREGLAVLGRIGIGQMLEWNGIPRCTDCADRVTPWRKPPLKESAKSDAWDKKQATRSAAVA